MEVEKLKRASELNRRLGDLLNNKSLIQSAIHDKQREVDGLTVFRHWPSLMFGYRVHCSAEIEDEMMEVALVLLDKKISEVNQEINEL